MASSATSAIGSNTSGVTTTAGLGGISGNDFMNILVKQLQMQDPMKPMTNEEMDLIPDRLHAEYRIPARQDRRNVMAVRLPVRSPDGHCLCRFVVHTQQLAHDDFSCVHMVVAHAQAA
jgi:hypothetical protein